MESYCDSYCVVPYSDSHKSNDKCERATSKDKSRPWAQCRIISAA